MLNLGDTEMGHRAQSKLLHIYDFSQVGRVQTSVFELIGVIIRLLYRNHSIGGTILLFPDSK